MQNPGPAFRLEWRTKGDVAIVFESLPPRSSVARSAPAGRPGPLAGHRRDPVPLPVVVRPSRTSPRPTRRERSAPRRTRRTRRKGGSRRAKRGPFWVLACRRRSEGSWTGRTPCKSQSGPSEQGPALVGRPAGLTFKPHLLARSHHIRAGLGPATDQLPACGMTVSLATEQQPSADT